MTESKDNPGYMGGIGKRSEARKLSYALKGAPMRTKDLRLNAVSGVAEARKLRDRITEMMRDREANPEDAMVYLVAANSDLSGGLDARPVGVTNGPSDMALVKRFMDKLPIGFLVFVWDREDEKQPIFGHARPLIVEDKRAISMNERALNTVANTIKRQLGITKAN
jgi:hypothetical protein